jgi:hypothetical protein
LQVEHVWNYGTSPLLGETPTANAAYMSRDIGICNSHGLNTQVMSFCGSFFARDSPTKAQTRTLIQSANPLHFGLRPLSNGEHARSGVRGEHVCFFSKGILFI